MLPKIFEIFYLLISTLDIYGVASHNSDLRFISKPLLMPILAVYFFTAAHKKDKYFYYILAAIFFSFGGDTFLLWDKEELFFILGLGSFLIGHVFYVLAFGLEVNYWKNASIQTNIYRFLPLLGFGAIMFSMVEPNLKDLKIPVMVYMSVILVMGFAAISRYDAVKDKSFWFCFIGAFLFVFSDSNIAMDKFYQHYETAGLIIMTTYILAQYFIVKGCLYKLEK